MNINQNVIRVIPSFTSIDNRKKIVLRQRLPKDFIMSKELALGKTLTLF